MTPDTERLTVDPAATGTATSVGATVGLNQSGFRYAKDDCRCSTPTVARPSSPCSAGVGHHLLPREEIDAVSTAVISPIWP